MNNLLKLIQPKDYKSKLKLYCKNCIIDNISPKKFAQKESKHYLCPIIIIKENERKNN